MVGVERFELPTSCSQSRRATGLRYTPKGISVERVIMVSNSGRKSKKHVGCLVSVFICEMVEGTEPFEFKTQGMLAASRTC